MSAIPLVIILATVALVCVVAWTQAAIWRCLDHMEKIRHADYDALHADTTLLRAQTLASFIANADPDKGGTNPSEHFQKEQP